MAEARTRRDEYSDATRLALVESATNLFATKGFSLTSLDEVAANARLTKGAIYHHFASKVDLFEAVCDHLVADSVEQIHEASSAAPTGWEGALAALDIFLETELDPVMQRVCFIEGPAAMGFDRWWAFGERYYVDAIRLFLDRMVAEGALVTPDRDTLSQMLFGAVTAGVLRLVGSDDPEAEVDKVRDVTIRIMLGLMSTPP
ncbi:MAG TPA: TetR/AcrR family transcriptional regulator [Acidimicrobiales bacterium]|jgi:AcrR family transcriptional regulator|nr:TetR/AcrR family transcriptional regulator [Acidimicrobiales bacterium]